MQILHEFIHFPNISPPLRKIAAEVKAGLCQAISGLGGRGGWGRESVDGGAGFFPDFLLLG